MSKKYVVSYRIGTDLLSPEVYSTKAEAEREANRFLRAPCEVLWRIEEMSDPPESTEELQDWAEDRGYVYSDSYFWDGSSDAYEAIIVEYEEPGFTVKVDLGDVFINGEFVSQLCWTPDAIGTAIAMWLEEQEGAES